MPIARFASPKDSHWYCTIIDHVRMYVEQKTGHPPPTGGETELDKGGPELGCR